MRNASLKQLRALSAVVRTGTVTAAANELNVTPPAVTTQIRLLEESVGLSLVERVDGAFQPTQAGQLVLGATKRIEAVFEECSATLSALRGGGRGRVSVGVVSTAKYVAPRAIAAFARDHPEVEIQLIVGNREDTIEALSEGTIDIAVMGRPPHRLDVEADVIGDHPHVIIAPPDHPLADATHIAITDLASETFLVREPGSGTRLLTERVLSSLTEHKPTFGMQIGSNETIKQAVMAGLGIALISAHTVANELESGRLVVLDVEGLPVIRQWFVVKRADRKLLPAAGGFRDFMVEKGGSFLPDTGL
ncbi:LysR family transcriptional regulator [Breoghania sp. L-A4]|uniref:LysR family transcriptional regulator n=1 Tax=Breoghania sp. L-A4 TaxID=2304600 RepID=UPI000E35BE61|nr:LysR family transcriptional regulator [Breoghania sp. L-A4]AXS41975.1 LysR family transcriptional regulator [Breoghania sp. L-A4]